jgi:poly-gamma-glutamate synthesis protein (capsule biosynthesis protein)
VVAHAGDAGRKNYTFRAHPQVLPVVKKHFDALALANNHSGDFGRAAFAEMLGFLRQNGLAYMSGGRNLSEAHAPWIVERSGLRIALLSYNEFMPRSFEADHDAPGVAWSEDEQVVDDIRRARQVHKADLVIPIMHWGWENETTANARQRQLARRMVEAGADAVIGGHPHVTQDIEHIHGKPVIYSVGNFVMKETDNDNQRRGWVLRLELDKRGVRAFDTRVAQIRMDGVPERDVFEPNTHRLVDRDVIRIPRRWLQQERPKLNDLRRVDTLPPAPAHNAQTHQNTHANKRLDHGNRLPAYHRQNLRP